MEMSNVCVRNINNSLDTLGTFHNSAYAFILTKWGNIPKCELLETNQHAQVTVLSC